MAALKYSLIATALFMAGCRTAAPVAQKPAEALVAGVWVYGSQKCWTEDTIIALKKAVAERDKMYPIMSFMFVDAKTVKVTTGVVRGPLNGGGFTYIFYFVDGKWISDRSVIGLWDS